MIKRKHPDHKQEMHLLLAEKEIDKVWLCFDTSVKAKARALSDHSAQQKAYKQN